MCVPLACSVAVVENEFDSVGTEELGPILPDSCVAGLVALLGGWRLVELDPVGEPVVGPLATDTRDEATELDPEIERERLLEAVLKLVIVGTLVNDEEVPLLDATVSAPVEVLDVIDDEPEVEDPVPDGPEIEVAFDTVVEDPDTVENGVVEGSAADDVVKLNSEEAAPEVMVRLATRLEDATDVVVSLDNDEEVPDVVVRLARSLDADADDELGDAVDTPTLSALMISAA